MTEEIAVGMGRLFVVDRPAILAGIGLGSCIGLMLYDPTKNISGFAHIMLPDSSRAKFMDYEQSSLVAEHEGIILSTITSSLSKSGFNITATTDNCDDTITKYKEFSPYLVFVDSQLPPSSAECVIEKLFEINKSANVLVANSNLGVDYVRYLSKGVIDIIQHPITQKKVDNALDFVSALKYMRFADVAIDKMLQRMLEMGCEQKNIKAKIAGGAHMFTHCQVNVRNIGSENIEAVIRFLNDKKIPIVAKECGGEVGRTVKFNSSTFKATITTRDGEKEI